MLNAPFKSVNVSSADELKAFFTDRMVAFFAIAATPAILTQLLRIPTLGFTWPMRIQCAIVIYIYGLFLVRKKISSLVKHASMIAILCITALSSLVPFGFSMDGLSYLLVAMVLTSIMCGTKTAVKLCAGMVITLTLIAAYHINDTAPLAVDLNMLVHNTDTWMSIMVSFTVIALALAVAVGTLHESHINLVKKLHLKNLEIHELAETDYLTGLANRRMMEDRLSFMVDRQRRHGGTIYLFYIDLDGFKAVNDTFNHSVGDFVLREVALRLKGIMRPDDVVARLGGDEFSIAVSVELNENHAKYAEHIANRIIESVSEPVYWEEDIINVSASVGIVEYDQAKRVDATTLMDIADAAMFSIKKSGKNGFIIQRPIFSE